MGDVALPTNPRHAGCLAHLTSLLRHVAPSDAYALSKGLIDEFGSLAGVFAANRQALNRIASAYPHVVGFLTAIRQSVIHALEFETHKAPVIATGNVLRDYLFARLGHATSEQFRVIFLDLGNSLIGDELMGIGTVDQTSAYPREIVKRALELGATNLILVHNHPSGNVTPSQSDIILTRRIATSCQNLSITVLDHIIVARTGWTSFRNRGLL